MSTQRVNTDRDLHKIVASSAMAKRFVPATQEQLDEAAPFPLQTEEMTQLLEEVRAKFNYMVDIHQALATDPNAYVTLFPREAIAIKPKRSNLYTAIVWWNQVEERFEVMSLRIHKHRRLASSLVRQGNDEYRVVGIRDAKRAAGFIAGLRSYTDAEVATVIAREMCQPMSKVILEDEVELLEATNKFKHKMNNETVKEVIRVRDCIKDSKTIDMAENSALLEQYSLYDAERRRVLERQGHTGNRKAMFMFRSVGTGGIVLFATTAEAEINTYGSTTMHHSTATDWLLFKKYRDFESLPHEVKRTVMTLEVKAADEVGLVKGVGYKPDSSSTFCSECCVFAIPEEAHAEFVKEAEAL